MLKAEHLTKYYDDCKALDDCCLHVPKNSIYGMVGVNGSGKTTLLNIFAGIYRPDIGAAYLLEELIYENSTIKEKIAYIHDQLYFYNNYNLNQMASIYRLMYPSWDESKYQSLTKRFHLPLKKPLNRFSKGMQKQAAFIFILSCRPRLILLDEPLDGLDPLVRKQIHELLIESITDDDSSIVLSSHNLREIEGLCDRIAILREGKIIVEKNLDDLKSNIFKIQILSETKNYEGLDIVKKENSGSLDILLIRGEREKIEQILKKNDPYLMELLPLSLEEIFIYENEVSSIE